MGTWCCLNKDKAGRKRKEVEQKTQKTDSRYRGGEELVKEKCVEGR